MITDRFYGSRVDSLSVLMHKYIIYHQTSSEPHGEMSFTVGFKVTHFIIFILKYCTYVNVVGDQKCHEKMKNHNRSQKYKRT